jgi:hypothetical protein
MPVREDAVACFARSAAARSSWGRPTLATTRRTALRGPTDALVRSYERPHHPVRAEAESGRRAEARNMRSHPRATDAEDRALTTRGVTSYDMYVAKN